MGPWLGIIDAILQEDKTRPAKQRHTAKRIFDRLREEHGFTGGYGIVSQYVRRERLRGQEMFVPLAHPAGEAQADFGEALVVIAGVEQKAHYLAFDLPHSDDCFVIAFPAETTEAFLEGHVRAFAYFGGVPICILYDNARIAVAWILGGEERQKTRAFSELKSYYLFASKFGRPAKGNDKGKVEGLVGYARRNFMVPIPRVSSWEELDAQLEAECRKRRERRLRGYAESIGERFERDREAMLPLPEVPYEACEKISARVSSLSRVRYRSNDYSVPTCYGHREVPVKGHVHEVVIACTLRGHENILKRVPIHIGAFNISLALRKMLGAGKPPELKNRAAMLILCLLEWLTRCYRPDGAVESRTGTILVLSGANRFGKPQYRLIWNLSTLTTGC